MIPAGWLASETVRQQDREERTMRAVLTAVLIAGSLALIAFLVTEFGLQSEAGAILVGAALGVAAAVPTSLLLLVILGRAESRQMEQRESQASERGYPPVIVIEPGSWQSHQAEEGWLLTAGRQDSLPVRQDTSKPGRRLR